MAKLHAESGITMAYYASVNHAILDLQLWTATIAPLATWYTVHYGEPHVIGWKHSTCITCDHFNPGELVRCGATTGTKKRRLLPVLEHSMCDSWTWTGP